MHTPCLQISRSLLSCVVSCFFGGLVGGGYNIGVLNLPEKLLVKFCKQSVHSLWSSRLESDTAVSAIWAGVVAIFLAAAALGAVTAKKLTDKIGRKPLGLFIELAMLVSAALLSLGYQLCRIDVFLLGRIVAGLASGMAMTNSPIYLNEVAPVKFHKTFGTLSNLGCCFGLLISQILGLPYLLGNESSLWLLLGGHSVFALIGLLAWPFSSESPTHLLITDQETEAVEAIRKLRCYGGPRLQDDINVYKSECKIQRECEQWCILDLVRNKTTRGRTLLLVAICFGQQMSGINAIMLYSTSIYASIGLSASQGHLATLGCSALQVAMALVTGVAVTKFRLRSLLLYSCAGSCLSLAVFTVTLNYMGLHSWVASAALSSMLVYVAAFSIGLGPIPWMLAVFMFSNGARSPAVGLSSCTLYMSSVLLVLLFPPLTAAAGITPCLAVFIVATLVTAGLSAKAPIDAPSLTSIVSV